MYKLKNTNKSFGVIAIAIHWIVALAVFGLFGLGLYMVELTYYDTWYKGSLDLHKSIGLTLLLLLIFRLVWRVLNVQPISESTVNWQKLSVSAVHFLLHLLPFALLLSGYLISTADERPIEVFGLLSVPALPPLIDNQEDIAGLVHETLAWGLIVLAGLHALAALKHHFIDKDQTLNRMLGRNKN